MEANIQNGIVSILLNDYQELQVLEKAAEKYAQKLAEETKLHEVYDLKGLAARLKMSRTTATALLTEGRIEYITAGTKKGYRISEKAVRKFLNTL